MPFVGPTGGENRKRFRHSPPKVNRESSHSPLANPSLHEQRGALFSNRLPPTGNVSSSNFPRRSAALSSLAVTQSCSANPSGVKLSQPKAAAPSAGCPLVTRQTTSYAGPLRAPVRIPVGSPSTKCQRTKKQPAVPNARPVHDARSQQAKVTERPVTAILYRTQLATDSLPSSAGGWPETHAKALTPALVTTAGGSPAQPLKGQATHPIRSD